MDYTYACDYNHVFGSHETGFVGIRNVNHNVDPSGWEGEGYYYIGIEVGASCRGHKGPWCSSVAFTLNLNNTSVTFDRICGPGKNKASSGFKIVNTLFDNKYIWHQSRPPSNVAATADYNILRHYSKQNMTFSDYYAELVLWWRTQIYLSSLPSSMLIRRSVGGTNNDHDEHTTCAGKLIISKTYPQNKAGTVTSVSC
jgi:hypothetical protein